MGLVERETNTRDNLLAAGGPDLVTIPITVPAGQGLLPRGQLMGRVTADDTRIVCVSTANDGSQTGDCILCEEIDATDAAVDTMAYRQGGFNENAVVFGGTDTADTHREALRAKSIFLCLSVAAV